MQMDLCSMVNKAQSECLNASEAHPLEQCLQKGSGWLESDTDAQVWLAFFVASCLNFSAPFTESFSSCYSLYDCTVPHNGQCFMLIMRPCAPCRSRDSRPPAILAASGRLLSFAHPDDSITVLYYLLHVFTCTFVCSSSFRWHSIRQSA